MTTACRGSMFVLVNVDKHRDVMGDIVKQLVTDYGVPVSIVDNVQKICPKCSAPSAEPDCSSSSSSTTSTSSSSTTTNTTTTSNFLHNSSSSSDEFNNSPDEPLTPRAAPNSFANMVVKSAPRRDEEHEPEAKRSRMEPPAEKMFIQKTIKEEIVLGASGAEIDSNEVLGNVLAALQNGSHMHTDFTGRATGSAGSSDDGNSNSSHIYDDEDMRTAPWASPDFLTNFITSQPDIFANGASNLSKIMKPSSNCSTSSGSNKRGVPPMLTVNGKTRRGRIVYTPNELTILEKYYEKDPNACADPHKREMMCKTLEIDYHRLKVWFQNRRRKDKVRSQEEAAASGTNDYYECHM
ncbi:unnamed protein product [Caenorhabditis sp. 36 PRJEB53466]|nr:unnamed protein product [Caenorhabditis sp. 36 PRJEB53466]